MRGSEALLKREYAWCVVQVDRANFIFFFVQVDRANFRLRNALWGVALGMHAQVNNNFHMGKSFEFHASLTCGNYVYVYKIYIYIYMGYVYTHNTPRAISPFDSSLNIY